MGHPSMKVFSAQSLRHFLFDHILSPWLSYNFRLGQTVLTLDALQRGRQSSCLACYGSYACICPGIEGIDLWRGYLEARMCWWYSSYIGCFWADKRQAWGKERKLGFDLWVSLASGRLWCQCRYTRMNAQTCMCAHTHIDTDISLLMLSLACLSLYKAHCTHVLYTNYISIHKKFAFLQTNKQAYSGSVYALTHSGMAFSKKHRVWLDNHKSKGPHCPYRAVLYAWLLL